MNVNSSSTICVLNNEVTKHEMQLHGLIRTELFYTQNFILICVIQLKVLAKQHISLKAEELY